MIVRSLFCTATLWVFFAVAEEPLASCFVNRWAFQSLCDFVFDPRKVWPTQEGKVTTFDPLLVKPGDMIFVRDAHLFFKKMHDAISVPYFIMTHGEYLDKFQPSFHAYLADKKILGWFTIHPCKEHHERVFPIPLGVIQYKELCVSFERIDSLFKSLRDRPKTGLLYMNFTDWGNPQRTALRAFFSEKPFCTKGTFSHFTPYIRELSKHKFVIAPPGLGPDCYRVWESLLVGTIPIVKRSPIDELYQGLPVVFVTQWEEVTESFLLKKWEELSSKSYAMEKLYMGYWMNYIKEKRELCMRATGARQNLEASAKAATSRK